MNMKWTRFVLMLGTILLQVSPPAFSQAENLQVHNLTLILADRSGRLFDEGTVETTLIAAPGYENGQTVGNDTMQFNLGDSPKTFPIRDGKADVKLLIQGDPAKEPFKYQFAGKRLNGSRFVSKTVEVTAETKSITLMAPDITAPLTRMETFGGIAFIVLALVLVAATFFYWGFRRMLFNRRMEVHSAVPVSRIITLLYVLITLAIAIVAWLRPDLWSRANSTYIGLFLIFFALYGIGFFFLFFFTRPRAVRS
jgi:hypothetical protein